MALLLFANNATTTLAGSISSGSTTVNLAAGTGALFAHPAAGQYFVGTFIDQATGLVNEIVTVTSISGDVASIVRGQEGTSARAWSAGDIFANYWTRDSAAAMVQVTQLQQQFGNYAVDSGSVNALTVSYTPAPTSLAAILGSPIRVKILHTNTGATTISVNGLAATVITVPGGAGLVANQLLAGQVIELFYDGSSFQFPAGVQQSGYRNMLVFSTPGTTSWTAPTGITRVFVQAVGGGGGSSGNSTTLAGAGGGGGEYRAGIIPVTPGVVYTIIVAAGGAGGGSGASGSGGGFSSFANNTTNFIIANGGSPGGLSGTASGGGAGGTGGTGTFGVQGNYGGDGGTAGIVLSGYGGGGAVLGSSIRGGFVSSGGGQPGTFPGGGGGGNYDLSGFAGSAGAGGVVILEW